MGINGRAWAAAALTAIIVMSAAAATWANDEKGNVVFFRGGWAGLTSSRGGELFTDVNGTSGRNDGSSGYYVGGGVDLLLSRDLWGVLERTWATGEVGLEYKRFSAKTVSNATALVGGTPARTQVTMLTIDVAPKFKFMEGSRLRPWIIPLGLDFHVISPPSNQGNYLDIGVQFGAGAEYQLWKELKLGLDGRFHLASGQTNTVNNFGTVGTYLGIGF
jgi:opacity protein-like surface antigen